jgi:magnesium transporter
MASSSCASGSMIAGRIEAGTILVPTLIAGIYGMNFRHMPELNWLWGYPFALGLMALSAGGLYWMFKRRGWR